jgi:hypothetical protein
MDKRKIGMSKYEDYASMKRPRMGLLKLLWSVRVLPFALAIIVLGLLSTGMAWVHWNEDSIDAGVIGKHIDYSRGESGTQSHYVVVTDKGALEVDTPLWDRIFNMGTSNADVNYAKIDVGQSYRFHTCGYRIDILWVYPIVTGIEKIG